MTDERELLDDEDADAERPVSIPPELPVLPLRDTVLFPNSFMPLAVARESSVRLIEEAIADDRLVGVFTQLEPSTDPGGTLSDRNGDAHPQDVQAARRDTAPHRAGTGPTASG